LTAFVKGLLPVFAPLGIAVILLIAALWFLWRKPDRKIGRVLVAFALVTLLVGSTHVVPVTMLARLEHQYPTADLQQIKAAGIQHVVVLGAGVSPDSKHPITSVLTTPSLTRLIEGIRILHALDNETQLVLCGRGPTGRTEASEMMKLAVEIGVSPDQIILEEQSMDTADQAAILSKMLGVKRFVLVTDASHLPRTMEAFQTMGMDPIPAPTTFQTHSDWVTPTVAELFSLPHSNNLSAANRLIYEGLGTVRTRAEIKSATKAPKLRDQ